METKSLVEGLFYITNLNVHLHGFVWLCPTVFNFSLSALVLNISVYCLWHLRCSCVYLPNQFLVQVKFFPFFSCSFFFKSSLLLLLLLLLLLIFPLSQLSWFLSWKALVLLWWWFLWLLLLLVLLFSYLPMFLSKLFLFSLLLWIFFYHYYKHVFYIWVYLFIVT